MLLLCEFRIWLYTFKLSRFFWRFLLLFLRLRVRYFGFIFSYPPQFRLFKHNNEKVVTVCCCCCCWESPILRFSYQKYKQKKTTKRLRWLVDERPGKPFWVFFLCSHTDAPVTRRKKNPIMKRQEKKNLECTFGYIPVDIHPTYFIIIHNKKKNYKSEAASYMQLTNSRLALLGDCRCSAVGKLNTIFPTHCPPPSYLRLLTKIPHENRRPFSLVSWFNFVSSSLSLWTSSH